MTLMHFVPVACVLQGLVPEAPHVYSANLDTATYYRVMQVRHVTNDVTNVTNVTSGFWRILARLHISAPYTLISCWCVIMSACGDITHHHHDHYVMSTVHLVQHYPDLVLLLPDGLDGLLELVTDVELVGVKQQDDAVSPLSKPGQYSSKVITPASVCQVACHSVFPV